MPAGVFVYLNNSISELSQGLPELRQSLPKLSKKPLELPGPPRADPDLHSLRGPPEQLLSSF